MKYLNLIQYFCFALLFFGCGKENDKKKIFDAQEHVINVKDKIVEISTDPIDISRISAPYILNEYLIIGDHFSPDKLIHIFNKNTFEYMTSIGDKGQGPCEIANMGRIVSNEKDRRFYVIDIGKQKILDYPIDSVLMDSLYIPKEKAAIKKQEFPYTFQYVNDTLSFALLMRMNPNKSDYKPIVSKWNMQTGEIVYLGDGGYPTIKSKRVSFDASVEHGIYVETYWHNELMRLYTIDGNLKYNIYGKNWNDDDSHRDLYFNQVAICKDKIVACYLGGLNIVKTEQGLKGNYPTQLLFFNLEGDYLFNLMVGYPITTFCYDEGNNRIVFEFNDEIQFGYLDMDEFI